LKKRKYVLMITGPVFPVMQWTDEDEVIRRANNTDMGLGASVWTKDQEQADRLSRQLQAGTVWVNTHMELRPDAAFGGHKFSGVGTELGINGLKSYCNIQTIHQKKA
jgi:acyl-CoA reductase-like NAD-dependent aldehyde dehydrogenase